MRVIHKEVKMVGRADEYSLVFIGDLHYGARACDRGLMERTFAGLSRAKNTGIVLMGDQFEAISRRDARFESELIDPELFDRAGHSHAKFFGVCADGLADVLRPCAGKVLAVLDGNHELRLRKESDIDMSDRLLDRLHRYNPAIERGTYESVLRLSFSRVAGHGIEVLVYAHHGGGGSTTVGGQHNAMRRMRETVPEADIYVCGHYHQKEARPVESMRVVGRGTNARLVERTQWFLQAPSFYRTYLEGIDTYASTRGYTPSVLGHIRVGIRPFNEVESLSVDGKRQTAFVPCIRPEWDWTPTCG